MISADPTISAPKRRGRGIALALGSFALGIAAAGGLIVAFEPFKQMLRGATTVAQAPTLPVASAPAIANAEMPNAPEQQTTDATPQPVIAVAATTPVAMPIEPAIDLQYALTTPARLELRLRPGERRSLDVRIEPMPIEAARLLVVFRQVPEWLSLSKGGSIGNEIWLLPAHQASDLAAEITDGAKGSADIAVELARLDGRIIASSTIKVQALGQPLAPPAAMTASIATPDVQMIQRLNARGELLLDTGEVEAARTLFRTAAEAGNVAAALRLAETYDPAEVQRLGMTVGSADPIQAVRWYEHAHSLGSPVAAARLVALGRR